MPSSATFVCLANSRKIGGRCVAGLLWDGSAFSKWLRPISAYGHGELNSERLYQNHSDPKLRDVIELGLLKSRPVGCHVEDHLIDPKKTWLKLGVLPFAQLATVAQPPIGPLWVNAGSTSHGENDSIPAATAQTLSNSLMLIQPKSFTITATREGLPALKKRVRGSFSFGKYHYTFSVTDPVIESEFASYEEGTSRDISKPLLCISIGEVFQQQNACYKLIAGVIEDK